MVKTLSVVLLFPILSLIFSISLLADNNHDVLLKSDLEWEPLNPTRGNKSPKAATLWGDRNGLGPTGFLVKFVDGFSSPPHIHNVSYRGLVIDGLVHNDDPGAEKMWMPGGSFWTQPAGETHITAAKGDHNLAYIEIDKGPYLVRPTRDSFDNGERPVNIDQSNIVWVKPDEFAGTDDIELAYLWGMPQSSENHGILVKIPSGKAVQINSEGSIFHAVIIEGKIEYQENESTYLMMMPGSYFSGKKGMPSKIMTSDESIIYFRSNGEIELSYQ